MQPNIIERVWRQDKMVNVDVLNGFVFTGEVGAHKFVISGKNVNTPVDISGTITANFKNADGVLVPLTGTIEDGKAVVVLSRECYAVEGPFSLMIFADTVCIYAAIANVINSSGEALAYPTASIPSVQKLIEEAQDVIASIPHDYSALNQNVQDLKSAVDKSYKLDQLLNNTKINWKNTNAVTNNNDGTYTIGTTDYGNIVFGDEIALYPGELYKLYGVPNGIAYVYPSSYTGSQSYANAIVTNEANSLKQFAVQEQTTVMVAFRSPSRPSAEYTIAPVLYRYYPATESPLYKKVVVCDGDSICQGYRDNPKNFGAWFGRLQNNYQAVGKNYSVAGATITNMVPTVSHSVALNIETIHNEYPSLDYLIFEGGTNDADRFGNFDGDTPPQGFGTWSDENTSDYNGNYDNTTFCGAVEELFYKAMTYWPNAKIGFIIPMQMGTLMVPSKRRRRYFDEIIKIAAKWHINVLDLWNVCHADARVAAYYGGTEGDLTKFYYDGQHPTSVGYDLIQPIIEAWMKTL